MDRAGKREAVAVLHDVFDKTGVVVVARYTGLTVADIGSLLNPTVRVPRPMYCAGWRWWASLGSYATRSRDRVL